MHIKDSKHIKVRLFIFEKKKRKYNKFTSGCECSFSLSVSATECLLQGQLD